MPVRLLTLLIPIVATFAGCSAYDTRYAFAPRPVETVTHLEGAPNDSLRTLAAVIGIRNADEDRDLPRSVEVRMLIDNTSSKTVRFDPAEMSLVSGDARSFDAPMTEPVLSFDIPPGDEREVEAWFPFPHDDEPIDLSGLNLRYTLMIDDRALTQSASFDRVDRYRYGRWHPHSHFRYGSHSGFGFGFGYSRWCW